jgi:hypothetical protein
MNKLLVFLLFYIIFSGRYIALLWWQRFFIRLVGSFLGVVLGVGIWLLVFD